jgi:hypothetical protein
MKRTESRHRIVVIRGAAADRTDTGSRRAVYQQPLVQRLVLIKNGEVSGGSRNA